MSNQLIEYFGFSFSINLLNSGCTVIEGVYKNSQLGNLMGSPMHQYMHDQSHSQFLIF